MTKAKAGSSMEIFKDAFNVLTDGDIVCVFDTETTGVGKDAKIIQFSAIRWKVQVDFETSNFSLKKIDFMDRYINPMEPLSEKIIEITGITDSFLSDAKDERCYCSDIYDYLANADVWVGHNVGFDVRMLDQMSERTGVFYRKRICIDTLDLARSLFPGKEVLENHKLGTVADHLLDKEMMDTQHLHSAIDDVMVTSCILEKMMTQYMTMKPQKGKIKRNLVYAWYIENPYNKKQKRLKIQLSEGDLGDIYYDVIEHCWMCKTTRKARELFDNLDIQNLEDQVIRKYAWRAKKMFPDEKITIDHIVKYMKSQKKEKKVKTA